MARRAVVYVQLDGHGGDVDGYAAERKAYRRGGRKQFFFEKKNQKTFVCLVYAGVSPGTYLIE